MNATTPFATSFAPQYPQVAPAADDLDVDALEELDDLADDADDLELASLSPSALMTAAVESKTATWEIEDFNFESIVADLDIRDVTGSLAMLEAHRLPFVRAARRAGKKNPAAEYYNVTNTPLFNRRIRLVAMVADLDGREDLTDLEDLELFAARNDLEALTELIVRLNYGMTRTYVKRFTSNTSAEDSADFQGAANVGLMVAIDSFDPSRGKFGSWAYKPIQRAVLKAVRDADFKNLNEGDFEKRPKVIRAYNELLEASEHEGYTPTYEEVAARAGVHHDLARRVLAAPYLDSLHTPVGGDAAGGGGTAELGDLIPDDDAAFEESVLTGMAVEALLRHGLSVLEPREHYVLTRVFGLDGEAADALTDIGDQLGLSREGVRQVRGKAMSKLLHPITLRKILRGDR